MSDDTKISVEIGASTDKLDAGMHQAAESVAGGTTEIKASLGSIGGATNSLGERFRAMFATIKSTTTAAVQASGEHASQVGQHAQRIGGALDGAVGNLRGQVGALSGGIGKISGAFAALAAVAAGIGVFKEGIAFTKQFTGEAVALSRALGISATEAATLNVALGDIYSSSETVIDGTAHLARQLRNNEEGLKAMGLKTRDANGEYRNMRDLLFDGVKVMASYKEGTDRALAGQVIFGKGAAEVGTLIKLNNKVLEDAAEKQRELGLTVTVEGVEATKKYKAAMNDVGDVMDALKKTIGDAVMPVFTKFGEWLSSIGPAAVVVMKGAIGGLAAAFWYLKNGVTVLWETINAMVVTVAEPIRALGSAIYKAMTGDWAGAKAEMAGIGTVVANSWKGAMDEIEKSSIETNERVKNLFMDGTATKATDTSKQRSFKDPASGDHGKKDRDERMKQWEADLLKQKTNYMLENEMREMSLTDEAAYWRKIVDSLKDGDNAKSAARKKLAEVEFQDAKRSAKQMQDLQAEVGDFSEKLALGQLEADKDAADRKLAFGLITQAQALQMEKDFEDRKYAINEAALRERLAMLDKDPTVNLVQRQKILDALLLMEQKHVNDVAKIQTKQSLESAKYTEGFANSIQSSFKQSIAGMINGTTTFAGAIKGLFKSILGAFADMVSGMVADWLFAMIRNKVVQAATGVSQVMGNAAVAASAAFASTAAIPIVGPELAPAAAAAAYTATAAFAPLASARNGFDIPAGLNPVTQLHEREMVLPQKQADAVRDMADGKGGGGGEMHVHIHATDAQSVERLFKNNGKHLVTALQGQLRNFAIKGAV